MTEKKIKLLQEKYPEILQRLGGDPSETCMSWMHGGIACGDGWFDLLDSLMRWCQFQHDKNYYPQLVAEQIKEKFGTLRFYFTLEDNPEIEKLKETVADPKYAIREPEYISGAVAMVEYLSGQICEYCGKPGKVRGVRWRQCACDDCAYEHDLDVEDEELNCEED